MTGKTVIFWGAGATATLGMRATAPQGEFIARLTGANSAPASVSLEERDK